MAEINRSIRYRINISRGMTGKTSWDATVEISDDYDLDAAFHRERILDLSDDLVVELSKRYPPEITEKKER